VRQIAKELKRSFVIPEVQQFGSRLLLLVLALGILTVTVTAQSSKPIAQLPNVYLDTTWAPPPAPHGQRIQRHSFRPH
jgi:hypothetical protein